MRGPFADRKPVYALDFGAFTIGAHLRRLSRQESEVKGLNADDMNLEAHFADPMEGHPDLRHDMRATVTPSFDGLEGVFVYKAKPNSRLTQVVDKIGVKVEGVFVESASSVDDGGDWSEWTRRRFIPSDDQASSIGEAGTWQTEVIRLSVVTTKPTDELELLGSDVAEVVATIGTLKEGDLVSNPARGTYQVRGVSPEGEYERARIER